MGWKTTTSKIAAVAAFAAFFIGQLAPGSTISRFDFPPELGHLLMYIGAVFAGHWLRPFRPNSPWPPLYVGFLLILAIVMENLQRLIPGRTYSFGDLALDWFGVLIASLAISVAQEAKRATANGEVE